MAKKTTTKSKVDSKATEISKLKKTIKDQENAIIIGNTTIETLGKKIDQNNIDIKGYKDKIAEYKKMIDLLNKQIVKDKKTTIRGSFYTKEKAETFIRDACGDKINYTYKVAENKDYPNTYLVMQTEQ